MKKVLSLVLVLTLVLGSFSFAFAAPASDVVGTEYEDAVERLGQLGVLTGYEDGTFKPGNAITRAEFAAVVVRAKGLEAAAKASAAGTAFTDVAPGSWAAGYVNVASKMGFVNGMGDGTFAPNSPVTYEQAVTMVMRALGYMPAAEARGGYPYGYLIVANEAGLLEKVNGTTGTPAPRGLVAKIVDNALEIPLMVQVSYGDRVEHIISGTREGVEEKTLLSDLGFTKFTGRVIEINASKEFVKVENSLGTVRTLYVDEDFDFQNALGLRFRVWHDTLSNVKLYTAIDTPMFDAAEHYKGGLYLYGEDAVYDLATNTKGEVIATLLLDGKKVDVEKFNADYAKLVLDSYGDVVWAEGFTIEGNVVVEKMDGNVVESFGYEELSLKGYTIVDRDGKTLSVEDIKENDIVLYNSKTGVKFAVVYNESVTGTIEKVYQNPDSFILDGDKYEVVHELGSTEGAVAKYLDGKVLGNLDYNTVNSIRTEDEEVTLYFDFYGNLLLVEGTRAATAPASVALVIDSVKYSSRGTDYYTLDVLNSEGKIVNYDLSQKEIYGILKANKMTENEATWSALVGVNDVTDPYATRKGTDKIVQLTINASGKVTGVSNIAKTEPIVNDNKTWLPTTATYVNSKAKLQSNAVVFRVDGETEHKYYSVTTWDKADEEFTRVEEGTAYYNNYNNVVAIYAKKTNATAASTYYTGLITDVRVLRGNLKADVTMEIKGEEKVIAVPKSIATYDKLVENTIVQVKVVNKTGEISEVKAIEPVVGKVAGTTPGSRIITVGSTNYYLENDAVIYQDKSFVPLRFADLKKGDDVALYPIDGNSQFVNYVVRGVTSTSGPIATQGTITYINGSTELTKTLVLDAAPGTSNKITVMYNNTGNKDVLVEKDTVTVRLVNTDNGTVVRTATAAADKFLAANLKSELGEIDLNVGASPNDTALVAGGNYEVRAYLNGEQLDGVAKVYVKSADAKAKSVTVDGVKATTSDNLTFAVQLPADAVLADVEAEDVVIVPNHAKAKITTAPSTGNNGVTWTAVITAENGTTLGNITINVTKFKDAVVGTVGKFDLNNKSDVDVEFTLNNAVKVKTVKVEGEALGVADVTVTTSKVTIAQAYLESLELEAGDKVKVTIEFEAGKAIEAEIIVEAN